MPYFDAPQDIQSTWDEYLTAFKREVYPIFARHGIDINTAHILYKINDMMLLMDGSCEAVDDDEPPYT